MKQLEMLDRLTEKESNLIKVNVLDTMLIDFNPKGNSISVVNLNDGTVYSSTIFVEEDGSFDNYYCSINGWILAISNTLLKKEFNLNLKENQHYLRSDEIFKLLRNQENQHFTNNKCHLNFFFAIDSETDEIYGFTSEKIKLPNKSKLHNWLLEEFQKRFGVIEIIDSVDINKKPIIDYLFGNGNRFRLEFGLDNGWSNYKFGSIENQDYSNFKTWNHNQSKKTLKLKLEEYFDMKNFTKHIKEFRNEKEYQFA